MDLTDDQLSMFVEKIPCYQPKSLVREHFRNDIQPSYQPEEWPEAWVEYVNLLRKQGEITRKAARQLRAEQPW